MKNFVQPGDSMPYTNGGSDITAGSVVVTGNQIGVASVDIASGATGELRMSGVFTLPKVSGAVFVAGEKLLWDVSAGAFDDAAAVAATGDVSGCCVAHAAGSNGQTTAAVRINVGVGTVA